MACWRCLLEERNGNDDSAYIQVYTVFDFDNNQIGFGTKPTVAGNSNSTGNQSLVTADSAAGDSQYTGAKVAFIFVMSTIMNIFFML